MNSAPLILNVAAQGAMQPQPLVLDRYEVTEWACPSDFVGTTHRFDNLDDAIAKASSLGKTQMNGYTAEGEWFPMAMLPSGQWIRTKRIADLIREELAEPLRH